MSSQSSKTTFNDDGSISIKTDTSTTTTTFEDNGDIVSVNEVKDEGGLISTRTTERVVFNEDGSIENKVTVENLDS